MLPIPLSFLMELVLRMTLGEAARAYDVVTEPLVLMVVLFTIWALGRRMKARRW